MAQWSDGLVDMSSPTERRSREDAPHTRSRKRVRGGGRPCRNQPAIPSPSRYFLRFRTRNAASQDGTTMMRSSSAILGSLLNPPFRGNSLCDPPCSGTPRRWSHSTSQARGAVAPCSRPKRMWPGSSFPGSIRRRRRAIPRHGAASERCASRRRQTSRIPPSTLSVAPFIQPLVIRKTTAAPASSAVPSRRCGSVDAR